jgi:hypothetical protein
VDRVAVFVAIFVAELEEEVVGNWEANRVAFLGVHYRHRHHRLDPKD